MNFLHRDINFCWFDSSPFPDYASQAILQWAQDVTKPACFIGTAVHEDFGASTKLVQLVESLQGAGIETVLIFDTVCAADPFYVKLAEKTRCIFINGFLYLTWREIFDKQRNSVNQTWNPQAPKWLFLTGKANKPNRLRLLYKFDQAGLLDNCIWSLLIDDPGSVDSSLVPELEDAGTWAWAKRRSPDDVDPCWINHCPVMSGFPFDSNMYTQSKFRVIAETNFNTPHRSWFTEKTWLTMFNRLPFIFAGSPLMLDQLRCMGFRTFEEYLPCSDYDEIMDQEQRLDAIVTNTKFWIENSCNSEKLWMDIEHNYTRALSLAQQHQTVLDELVQHYNLQLNSHELISEL